MAYADTIRTTTFTASDIATLIDGLVTADIDGTYLYAGVSAGTTTITASLTQAPSAYANGQGFVFVAGGTNNGSATINFNSLGAITLYDPRHGSTLIGNEILSGSVYKVVYYNTKFWLLNGNIGSATWSPTITGFSANPTNTVYYYMRNGRFITCFIRQATVGTSNATGFTITAPFTALTLTNMVWTAPLISATNNSAVINTGIATIASGSATINLYIDNAGTAWTAAGTKGANMTLTYESAT